MVRQVRRNDTGESLGIRGLFCDALTWLRRYIVLWIACKVLLGMRYQVS